MIKDEELLSVVRNVTQNVLTELVEKALKKELECEVRLKKIEMVIDRIKREKNNFQSYFRIEEYDMVLLERLAHG